MIPCLFNHETMESLIHDETTPLAVTFILGINIFSKVHNSHFKLFLTPCLEKEDIVREPVCP